MRLRGGLVSRYTIGMKKQWIGLLDCNNFYVSCERLFRPDLKNRPVVVLSSNDGCVVARSEEIKDSGIQMGVPYFQIKDKLKEIDAVAFSSNFNLYRDISRRVFSTMRQMISRVEQYSVDEAFFMVESPDSQLLDRVKAEVECAVGIPVSIGVSVTKTQAKYANKLEKRKRGLCLLDSDDWSRLVSTIPLRDIWGVGKQLELRFTQHRLFTVLDLLKTKPGRVRALFGINGLRLQQELSGVSVYPLTCHVDPQQSIMHSRSLQKATTDQTVLKDALAYHTRQIAKDMRASGQLALKLRVFLLPSRHGYFFLRGGSLEVVLPVATSDTLVLLRVATALFDQLYEPEVPYQKVGVAVSELTLTTMATATLFEGGEKQSSNPKLMAVIDQINRGSNRELVSIGSRLRTSNWQPRADVCSPSYTTKWSEIALVKAINHK